jgi:hypothetical protein
MKKSRNIHIDDKIIKWRLHHYKTLINKPYIGIYDGKYHKVFLCDFIKYIGER